MAQCTQGSSTTFQKVFGDAGNERAHSVQQTADGGYIIVGETTSFGAGGMDIFVMKMSANGNVQWTKTFGSTGTEDGNSITVKQTSDLGYIVCGHTTSFGSNAHDPYTIKLDNIGNILWEKRLSGSNNDRFRDVIETQSGDFMFVGTSNSYGAGNSDFYVVKMDGSGNLLWTKTYGGSSTEHAPSVIEISFNNFLVVGTTLSYGAGNLDGFVVKIDQNGILSWAKSYGGSLNDGYLSSELLSDGNVILVGYTDSYGAGQKDIMATKVDTLGGF